MTILRPEPPQPVPAPAMYQSWTLVTFLHWRCDPEELRRLIPAPLAIDTLDGEAWIGVTPFLVRNLRPPLLPPLPWLSRFPETNVRTYVRGPDGYPGIWFFSLDAARLPAVLAAKAGYGLPYKWSWMSVEQRGWQIHYRSCRRAASSRIVVEPGAWFERPELTDLDHFLTARFRLYTVFGSRIGFAQVEHPPWPLRRARAIELEEDLTRAAGIRSARGDPLVHYSPGVHTRIGAPHYDSSPQRPRVDDRIPTAPRH